MLLGYRILKLRQFFFSLVWLHWGVALPQVSQALTTAQQARLLLRSSTGGAGLKSKDADVFQNGSFSPPAVRSRGGFPMIPT